MSPKRTKKKKFELKKERTLHTDDELPPIMYRRDEDSHDDKYDDDEPPPLGNHHNKDSSDEEEEDYPPPEKPRAKRKTMRLSLRQRALVSTAHLTGQDVSSTSAVYHASIFPELLIVVDSGALVSVTPHIRDFRRQL
jgi:hypothetical protein